MSICAPYLSIIVAVLHAPCFDNNEQAIGDWWDATDALMLSWPDAIKLIDANGRVGSEPSSAQVPKQNVSAARGFVC